MLGQNRISNFHIANVQLGPLLKPDWRISFKGDSIYRAREPNWLGKYQNSKEKFDDYNTETKMLKGAEKQPAVGAKGYLIVIAHSFIRWMWIFFMKMLIERVFCVLVLFSLIRLL
jgi:hypothetical protein